MKISNVKVQGLVMFRKFVAGPVFWDTLTQDWNTITVNWEKLG